MMRAVDLVVPVACMLATGCATDDEPIIYTGQTYRYAIDDIWLPTTNTRARELGGDLTGDGTVDNALGMVISSLAVEGNITSHGFDMIAGGRIASTIELVADDPLDDPTVAARYIGADGAAFVTIAGRLEDGWFRATLPDLPAPPPTHEQYPPRVDSVAGQAELHLPVFDQADPSVVHANNVRLILAPDGAGGFNVTFHGAVPIDDRLWTEVYRGMSQLIASEPSEHRVLMALLDMSPKDGTIQLDDITNNSLLRVMLSPDIAIDGQLSQSFGFRAHARPCESDACLAGVVFDACFDRVRNGDETDVDCGGSCRRCEANATCTTGDDCETTTCEQGRCGAPSCTNSSRDGLESDVDCGATCGGCADGKRCYYDTDCASGQCGVPCVSNDPWDCLDLDFSSDVCFPPS